MSGFDTHWLALREPVDAAARDETLLLAAAGLAEAKIVVDIGCGTGSTYRTISPRLSRPARWRLIDHDARLLDEAGRRHGDMLERVEADINAIATLPLSDAGLVTASALFDLCSKPFISTFVARLAEVGAPLYAALNYDGSMQWSKHHPLDEAVTEAFNAHQRCDKGLGLGGASLGPQAWSVLADRLKDCGYRVRVAESPWVMSAAELDLQRMFLDGVAVAVFEQGEFDEAELREWKEYRRRQIERQDCLCRVGHQDVLAIR